MARIFNIKGYRMFRGIMKIDAGKAKAQEIYGDWLYRPDTNSWYSGGGLEFAAERCVILEVE